MQSGSWVSKMKGGNTHRIRGKHFSSTLIFLVLMTVFLWSFEKKPPSTSLFSSPGHLDLPGSDATFSASRVSKDFSERKYHAIREDKRVYGEIGMESERLDSDDLDVDSTPLTSSRTRENDNESASALHNNGNEEAYPKNDENLELSDLDRGTDNEKRLFDGSNADFTQKNESDSTSFLENNHKEEAYPKNGKGSNLSDKDTVCNYAKGRWVVANRRPLYSGLKCKQWLSEMWACRLSERPDFTYESYRWQPENCEMPEFDRSEFMRRMQDKTIAFVGDSLGRQQFQSFMCMVTGGEEDLEVQDVGSKYGFVLEPGAVRPNGWAFWFPETNTTILFYWSACLCDLEPLNSTDPATEVAMHLDRPPSFLQRFLPQFDVLILNTGHHWNRGKVNANRWVMHSDGKPVKNKRLAMVGNAKNFTIHSVARWLDNQLQYHPHIKAFFRTISPRHFFNGDWNTGGSCENTTPLAKGSAVLQNESSDPVIAGAVKGSRVRLLDITALSTLRDEGHISRYSTKTSQGIQDCLHWCLPGIPDTWNEIVAAQL